ncbi:hypothetical protein HDU67_000420 [Dinochytrium kinnereticum]|nr:hypothetical protein HDU67_000420 [Dinochytrium kinnereticum]
MPAVLIMDHYAGKASKSSDLSNNRVPASAAVTTPLSAKIEYEDLLLELDELTTTTSLSPVQTQPHQPPSPTSPVPSPEKLHQNPTPRAAPQAPTVAAAPIAPHHVGSSLSQIPPQTIVFAGPLMKLTPQETSWRRLHCVLTDKGHLLMFSSNFPTDPCLESMDLSSPFAQVDDVLAVQEGTEAYLLSVSADVAVTIAGQRAMAASIWRFRCSSPKAIMGWHAALTHAVKTQARPLLQHVTNISPLARTSSMAHRRPNPCILIPQKPPVSQFPTSPVSPGSLLPPPSAPPPNAPLPPIPGALGFRGSVAYRGDVIRRGIVTRGSMLPGVREYGPPRVMRVPGTERE